MENSESKKYSYSDYKRRWVTTNNGKKIKFRQYISDLASKLSKFNGAGYHDNRTVLIQVFETHGLDGIKSWVNKVVNIAKEAVKKQEENEQK